ncbi:MAG: RagB/SusD family nutrient uptake outer membrane protein [Muricauda sp.]|nr:RagB/SusD family nutrient uptake outer membrane protein [Allomuricauda sp.]MBA4745946.1 RagB/SusD family nutrient uptake outer membrane protein [Allomuricauda sp.]
MKIRNIQSYNLGHLFGSLLLLTALLSCEDFLEVDPPIDQLTGTVVFEDAATVDAALAHIYAELRENSLVAGTSNGLGYMMGHYTDELDLYSLNLPDVDNVAQNSVLPSDNTVRNLWNSSYNIIYAANRILEGVESSTGLSEMEKDRFLGEAHFIRSFLHFHLVNLFGPVPYVNTTDYDTNNEVSRTDTDRVYQNILEDLNTAKALLPLSNGGVERLRPDHWTAAALLSRVHLYMEDWEKALDEATYVIANGGFALSPDLNGVFLKESPETLWQLGPNLSGDNTNEGFTYIIVSGPPPNSALSQRLLDSFEEGDARSTAWVGSVSEGEEVWYFNKKYKEFAPTAVTRECSVQFRLAELYLIRAESHARLGNPTQALANINALRARANLDPLSIMDQASLLDAVLTERRVELFLEQGHRFFDLKRTVRANAVLGAFKSGWESTDRLLPIPESELLLNPKLQPQNEGY